MNNEIYAKAYKEVNEILKHMEQEDIKKIPLHIREAMENAMDKKYEYKIEQYKEFEKQKMLKETRAILAVLYRDYWATEDEKKIIIQREREDMAKEEEEKNEKYPSNDLFKNKTNNNLSKQQIGETIIDVLPTEIEKETWYNKFLKFMTGVWEKRKK